MTQMPGKKRHISGDEEDEQAAFARPVEDVKRKRIHVLIYRHSQIDYPG